MNFEGPLEQCLGGLLAILSLTQPLEQGVTAWACAL